MSHEGQPTAAQGQHKDSSRPLHADDFDYHLPEELIADHPAPTRDSSRLMVVGPGGAPVHHTTFADIVRFLRPGDVLVVNDSRVLPARLLGTRIPTGAACEVLLLRIVSASSPNRQRWSALVRPGRKLQPGARIAIAQEFTATIVSVEDDGSRVVELEADTDVRAALEQHGQVPLPPYILARRGERTTTAEDRERYQTVYAREEGSVAAPTAGLHFTPALLEQLADAGISIQRVTLHVGAGTFQPLADAPLHEQHLHSETWSIPESVARTINDARAEGRRIVAVGTTSVRTLESAATPEGIVNPGSGETTLMIAPGYRFRVIDALVTNFHLPKSSLLCLVSAFVGRERLLELYAEAIDHRYRFYSYGDAMFFEGPADGKS